MSQYISRERLYEQLRLSANRSTLGETTPSELTAKEILSVIADMPTSDVVEVVRCKDCGYCKTECEAEHGRTQHYCKKNGIFVSRDFFCSYGKVEERQVCTPPIKDTACDGVCYDCPNKWTTTFCGNEDIKYEVIIKNIERAIAEYGEKKFWIPVDWEESDTAAMRAWKRAKRWLTEHGFVCTGITFQRWLVRYPNGKPYVSCGGSSGTAYIRRLCQIK